MTCAARLATDVASDNADVACSTLMAAGSDDVDGNDGVEEHCEDIDVDVCPLLHTRSTMAFG